MIEICRRNDNLTRRLDFLQFIYNSVLFYRLDEHHILIYNYNSSETLTDWNVA